MKKYSSFIFALAAIILFTIWHQCHRPVLSHAYEDEIGAEYIDRDEQGEIKQLFGGYLQYVVEHEIDWNHMVVFIELDESILEGTDSNCELFGHMMHHITGHGMLVYITNNGWIPSKQNPIDHYWAEHLAGFRDIKE